MYIEYKRITKKECEECGEEIKGRGVRFCCEGCSRLWHRREYKKRNKEKVNAYSREWRKYKKGSKGVKYSEDDEVCYFCNSRDRLQWHHISWKPEKIIRLCCDCHRKLHRIKKIEEKDDVGREQGGED